jgi:hypothetical protein
MSKLVIVGTVAFDAIETPFGKTDKILGGAATYIGLSSAQFDIDPAIVSVVGGDFLQSDIQMLEGKGINTQGLEIVKDGKTFFWSGKYHNDMNSRDTLATELNVLETFTPVVPDSYKDSERFRISQRLLKCYRYPAVARLPRPCLTSASITPRWVTPSPSMHGHYAHISQH